MSGYIIEIFIPAHPSEPDTIVAAMVRREEMKLWPMGSWEYQRQLRALREHEKWARE